jgi:hypothetical protein
MHGRRESQEEPEEDQQQPGKDPDLQEKERMPQEDIAQEQDKREHVVAAGDGEVAGIISRTLSVFYVKMTRASSKERRALGWRRVS